MLIHNYVKLRREDPHKAVLYILREFYNQEKLNSRYIPMFMTGIFGDGYDPVNNMLYMVDPDLKSLTFRPKEHEFCIFERENIYLNEKLIKEGKLPLVQKLHPINYPESLEAHIYDPKEGITKIILESHKDVIRNAKHLANISSIRLVK